MSVKYLYRVLCGNGNLQNELENLENCTFKMGEIPKMIDHQTKLFCDNQKDLDFIKIFDSHTQDEYFLGKYLHSPLLFFF